MNFNHARRPQRRVLSSRRGSALVEMALVLPILLILSMLIVQYGIVINASVALTNLSREGARYAAVQPSTDAGIRGRIQNVCPPIIKWSDISGSGGIVISPSQGSSSRVVGSRQLITVSITYDMKHKLFLPATFFGIKLFSTNYTAKTSMMVE